MKVIIFGSNGMLGTYMYKYICKYHDVIGITRDIYNVEKDSFEDLTNICEKYNIDKNTIIINCIGLLPHRFNSHSMKDQSFNGETNKSFILINSIFPHNLEKVYMLYHCKVIHITSDCVFKGDKGQYDENDTPDLNNIYGITKTLGECERICTIRSSIIGEELANKKSLLEWVLSQKNKNINGYSNYIWNGVTCLELAKVINNIISTKNYWKGVRHLYSPDIVSKYDLCCMINRIYNLNINIEKYYLENKIDRTLQTIYSEITVSPLENQITELKNFKLN